ncbi:FAD-linked oxidase C-terminal domain-containing protein [Martelella sp. AD-3]|uniref:FAD-binding oxidoreductase n=1 Tax=Martelella sp. AD-3 TaxID=686597 RepID=UPI00046467A2|nr:FAD-linked oxidase C-terminal domain-containing protein [Martelella sp. AD-3]AMM83950.1 lactate dehydrogenase [Martelella sp. AD-3]
MAIEDVQTRPRDPQAAQEAIALLRERFGDKVQTGEAFRAQHAHTTTYLPPQLPDAVFFAESSEDVKAAVKLCAEYKVPVIPFGTGSSLEGQVNAPEGGISIDLSRMNRVLEVNAEDLDCRVEPGVTREELNDYLRDTGLFFPIDPGANASLGGMASTRASGTNAVRYGTMKDVVLALTVVTADGEEITTGRRARKSSAGYDLTRLFVGAEGTLGIITSITLKLAGIPEKIAGGVSSFETLEEACNAVIMTIQMGIPVARIELLDALQVKACNAYSGLDFPETPLLLLEFHGSEEAVAMQSAQFAEIASECSGSEFVWTANAEERTKLWKARHSAYWAGRALAPELDGLSTDVCVPISRLADCVRETQEDVKREGILAPVVGHAGDGNFHLLVLFDKNNPEEIARVEAFTTRLAERAIAMGGTATGEHGVGQGKKRVVADEIGTAVAAMRAIKEALDPDNIFNPGKIF